MALRRQIEAPVGEDHEAVIALYRERLAAPAVMPWKGLAWEPVRIGPTWQTYKKGRHHYWLLPDASLGWDVIGWCGTALQHHIGEPWRFTLEQARFALWWYSLDEAGRFLYRDFVLQRLKGWGKDPIAACFMYAEMLGPVRFAGWDGDTPIACEVPDAWVQTAAVAQDQTRNTMRLLPGLITPETKAQYGVQIQREHVYALGDTRMIEAVTSNPSKLHGNRATSVLLNETHQYREANRGHEMAAVVADNATKSPDGAARTGRITNAYEPSEDSVAQRDREAHELVAAGGAEATGLLYDSLEAPPSAPLNAETAHDVVLAIRGDSVWLQPQRIIQRILDTRNPPSRSRRFWYNQITATEDAWLVPQEFDACTDPDRILDPGDELLLFFDGSKSDDATALMGCRVADGHLFTLGMWQRPPGLDRDVRWLVDRSKVDDRVTELVTGFAVVGLWADPSHALDDETEERYWDGLIDDWHRRWKDQLTLWAKPGKGGHSVLWDMAAPGHTQEFTVAAERFASEVTDSARAAADGRLEARVLTHDGDGRLVRHARNAHRYPNRYGVSLWKGARGSQRKIDLAIAAVGSRMMRRQLLNAPSTEKKKRTGQVW